MSPSFGGRLAAVFAERGHLCVGIDPHPYLLNEWGLPDTAAGLREFGLRVVAATAPRAGIVKPQVAFFERHGSAGFAALETVLQAAMAAGIIVIADVKRGDVGTSVEAYAQAWLTPGSPLEADAMTISAYQGFGSIHAPLDVARRHGKGLFVLAATSNPEATTIQTAVVAAGRRSAMTVAAGIVADVIQWNQEHPPIGGADPDRSAIGCAGIVLGATVDLGRFGIDLDRIADDPATPVLAPGFGHQGASTADVAAIYGPAAATTIVNVSRSILSGGARDIAARVAAHSEELSSWRG